MAMTLRVGDDVFGVRGIAAGRAALLLCLVLLGGPGLLGAQADPRSQNVVLIVLDGLRWQEVFRGADSLLMHSDAGGISDTARARQEFWRATPPERRRVLLPFLWDSVATRGQILGDVASGSVARVTNGHNFSYPGYNEVLTGRPDPRINTNAYPPNPNVTVFEWLAAQPIRGKGGRVRDVGRVPPHLQSRSGADACVGRLRAPFPHRH